MYEEEQRGYYILSSFWAELDKDQVLGEPAVVRAFDMHTCTLEDVQVRKHAPTRRRAFRLCIARLALLFFAVPGERCAGTFVGVRPKRTRFVSRKACHHAAVVNRVLWEGSIESHSHQASSVLRNHPHA